MSKAVALVDRLIGSPLPQMEPENRLSTEAYSKFSSNVHHGNLKDEECKLDSLAIILRISKVIVKHSYGVFV